MVNKGFIIQHRARVVSPHSHYDVPSTKHVVVFRICAQMMTQWWRSLASHYAPSETRADLGRKKFCAICLKQHRDGLSWAGETGLSPACAHCGSPGRRCPADMSNWIRKITKINNFHPCQPGQQPIFTITRKSVNQNYYRQAPIRNRNHTAFTNYID